MTTLYTSDDTKRLALRYLLENIDFRKRSLYLQEIISLSRINDVWRQALIAFLNTPVGTVSSKSICNN